MTVTQHEWVQREWTDAGVTLYRNRGDFYTLDSLLPDDHGLLRRVDGWSSHVDLPSGIENIRGGFFDEANRRYVLIGQNTATPATKIVSTYYSSTWAAVGSTYDLVTATNALGGKDGHNVAFWGGDLYLIGVDGKVYRGSSYTSALAEFYGTGDAYLLGAVGDRMYMVTTAGVVYRLNDADDAFESHYDPVGALDVQFFAGFRGYLVLFARGDDGCMSILRLPDRGTETPVTVHEVATVAGTGDLPEHGLLFAMYDDEIYFSPGRVHRFDTDRDLPIYRFNGSRVDWVATVVNDPSSTETVGLAVWEGRLVYYELDKGGSQVFKVLVGGAFVDLPDVTPVEVSGYRPWLGVLGGDLVVTGNDTTNGEGLYHAGGTHDVTSSALADGSVATSWLDMDRPGREKRLEQITVVLDGAVTDFKVVVKYRTDDNTSWTTATTGNNTTVVRATALGVAFYKVQLKIELDDDTDGQHDIRIAGISVIYTEPE